MKNQKFEGAIRGYHRYSKAWYAQIGKIEVQIVLYAPFVDGKQDGCFGEFCIEWITIGRKLTPRLRCFDDAWAALLEFSDLLEEMANVDGEDISEDAFCKILDRLGIEDMTNYTQD